jgi:hypothetical protein
MKKTLNWTEVKKPLLEETAEIFGAPLFREYIDDFVEYTRTYSFIDLRKLTEFLVKFAERDCFTDVSDEVCKKEDATLFESEIPAWKLILNASKDLTAWKYLDTEQNGVVHYAYNYRTAFYLEAFFCSEERGSYLHICEYNGRIQFVPVLFTPEFNTFRLATDLHGAQTVRAYLPRDVFQFLSKKGCRPVEQSPRDKLNPHDNGDLL